MQRSEALAELSRDHHQALFVAQRLRRATAASAAQAYDAFLVFWHAHGREHFAAEEEELLPALSPGPAGRERPEVLRTLVEHTRIRRAAAELTEDVDALRALGDLLHDHVRFEERELFGLVERELDDDELAALGRRLAER